MTDRAVPLEELFELHHRALWRFAVRLSGDPEEAADAVQETFLRALRGRLPSEPRAAESWLMRTTMNLCHDRHRKRRVRRLHRERVTRDSGESPGHEDPHAAAEAGWELDRAVGSLPVRRRAVLVLRELEGREIAEIARLLGISEVTVRWHLAAAKRAIRAALSSRRDE